MPEEPGRGASILLLCDDSRSHADTILQHIAALKRWSRFKVRTFNPRALRDSRFLDLEEFDAVVIHYSLVIISDHYLAPAFREKIRLYKGPKVMFIQDDYRWVDEITAMMRDLGIKLLFTLVPEEEIPKIWDETRTPGIKKVNTLAGYVATDWKSIKPTPLAERTTDIGYRGREVPYWIGRVGQDKVRVGQGVLARATQYDLNCDIAWTEADRIYGRSWVRFLSSCRATLGTESGATITDFDGSIERRVRDYLAKHPSASFEEVHRRLLAPFEGNVKMRVVSPRIFEAAMLRTAMILFPGYYSGTIRPWEHYIPLAKDFSNLDEVVAHLRDDRFLEEMTERSHADLIRSGRYSLRSFVAEFDDLVGAMLGEPRRSLQAGYRLAATRRAIRVAVVGAPIGRTTAIVGDRLSSRTFRRFGLDPLNYFRKGRVALRSGMGDRELRRLLTTYLGDSRLRAEVPLDAFLEDLLKIATARQARLGRLTAGPRFSVAAVFDLETGELRLSSRPEASADAPSASPPEPISLEGTTWGRISWDHAAVGSEVYQRLSARRWLAISLGPSGRHEFTALGEVIRRHPELGWPLVRVFFEPPAPANVSSLRRFFSQPSSFVGKGSVALSLILRDQDLTRILGAYLKRSRLRREVRLNRAVEELVKLDLLRRAQTRRLTAGTGFGVEVKLEGHGTQLLVRSRLDPKPPLPTDRENIREVVLGGRLTSFTWDHSRVGTTVYHKLSATRWMPIAIGTAGRFEFVGLVALGRSLPAELLAALEPLLAGHLTEPGRPNVAARLLRDPFGFIGKSLMTAQAVAGDEHLRRLLIAYLAQPGARSQVGLDRLLEDLVKLRMAHRMRADPATSGVDIEVRYDRRFGTLRLTSRSLVEAGPAVEAARPPHSTKDNGKPSWATATPNRILWDHSRVAPSIRYPALGRRQLMLALGARGVHEFAALEVMQHHFPELTMAALLHALSGLPGKSSAPTGLDGGTSTTPEITAQSVR